VPTFIGLVLVRFIKASHSSRARIKLLEKDEATKEGRLITMLARLEKQMEDAVVEVMEEPGQASDNLDPEAGMPSKRTKRSKEPADKEKPELLPEQIKAAKHLNALPNLQKVRAYFPDVYNSHAVIISRDVKRFEFHRRGHGVIRHWADGFVL
jgi:hypothetical protein